MLHLSPKQAFNVLVRRNVALERFQRELEAYVARYPGTPKPERKAPTPEDYPPGKVASKWMGNGILRFMTRADVELLNAATEEVKEWWTLWVRRIRTIPPFPEKGEVAYKLFLARARVLGAEIARRRSGVTLERVGPSTMFISGIIDPENVEDVRLELVRISPSGSDVCHRYDMSTLQETAGRLAFACGTTIANLMGWKRRLRGRALRLERTRRAEAAAAVAA